MQPAAAATSARAALAQTKSAVDLSARGLAAAWAVDRVFLQDVVQVFGELDAYAVD